MRTREGSREPLFLQNISAMASRSEMPYTPMATLPGTMRSATAMIGRQWIQADYCRLSGTRDVMMTCCGGSLPADNSDIQRFGCYFFRNFFTIMIPPPAASSSKVEGSGTPQPPPPPGGGGGKPAAMALMGTNTHSAARTINPANVTFFFILSPYPCPSCQLICYPRSAFVLLMDLPEILLMVENTFKIQKSPFICTVSCLAKN